MQLGSGVGRFSLFLFTWWSLFTWHSVHAGDDDSSSSAAIATSRKEPSRQIYWMPYGLQRSGTNLITQFIRDELYTQTGVDFVKIDSTAQVYAHSNPKGSDTPTYESEFCKGADDYDCHDNYYPKHVPLWKVKGWVFFESYKIK